MKNTSKLSFLICISLIFNSTVSLLQAQSSLDSLQKVLKQTQDTPQKVDVYNNIVTIHIQKSDSTNTIQVFGLAIKLAKSLNYWQGLAQAHLNITELYFSKNTNDSLVLYHLHESLYAAKQAQNFELQVSAYKKFGIIYRRKGDYNLALQNYQFALQIYEKLQSQEGIALIQNNIANVYSSLGNFNLALDYMLKSLRYWENQNDKEKIGITSNNLALIYLEQKNYTKALSYFFRSLEILESFNNEPRVASTCNNLGITFKDLKDYSKSQFYYEKALNIYQKLEDDYGIARVLHNKGVSYQYTNEYEKALKNLEQALEIRKQLNTRYGLASTMIEMGEVHRYLKNYEQAESFLIKGKEIAQEIKRLDKVQTATNYLAKLYYNKGQYKQAYEMHLLYSQLSDSLLNNESIWETALIDANYKFQLKLDSLQQIQDEEKKGLKSNQSYQRWWIIILIVSIVILLIMIWMMMIRRRQLSQTVELEKIKQKLLQEQLERKEVEGKIFQEQLSILENKDFELTRQALHLVQKRQLLDKITDEIKVITKSIEKPNQNRLKNLLKTIRKETSAGEEWRNFTQIFEMAHPNFFTRLQQNFPELTDNDLRLSALLRLGFDSTELALILNITPNSVRTARMRLRKKLGLTEEKLSEFMREF